jgi:hypothetical protein
VLLPFGYDYIVIDEFWYSSGNKPHIIVWRRSVLPVVCCGSVQACLCVCLAPSSFLAHVPPYVSSALRRGDARLY